LGQNLALLLTAGTAAGIDSHSCIGYFRRSWKDNISSVQRRVASAN
jgi:hypothetical protein